MKRIITILSLLLSVALAHGQTACSVQNPCVNLTITNSSMAATVTTSTGGVEISGPGTATLYKCQGSSTSCTSSALNATGGPAAPWALVSTFPQTASTVQYSDPEPYNALMNYAASNSWTGGGTGPISQILIFQDPQAPQVSPNSGSVSASFTTTGVVGPH